MRKAWLHSLKIVVAIFWYFVNDVLINYALRHSIKLFWIDISERNTAFIEKNEIEFVLPFPFFYVSFGFLQGSKKMTLLKKVVEGNQHYRNGQKIMFDTCVTSLVEDVDGYERFFSAIAYIVEAFEVIAYKSGSLYNE